MKKQTKIIGFDPGADLRKALERKAAEERRTLSSLIRVLLERALAMEPKARTK